MRNARNKPSRHLPDRIGSWLQRSAVGHCGDTEYNADCSREGRGAWTISRAAYKAGWAAAARECLRRCAKCAQCRVVSISLKYADCSWYTHCPILQQDRATFRSASAYARPGGQAVASQPSVFPNGTQLLQHRSTGPDVLDRMQSTWDTASMHARPLPKLRSGLLLLGLISGSFRRRELLRCTWFGSLPAEMRARFVVGLGQPDLGRADVLGVPIEEQLVLRRGGNDGDASRLPSGATTWTLYAKVMYFLRFAVTQPEPLVAKGDDDLFVVPQMLAVHASLLHRLSQNATHMVAGVFDYFSWKPASLTSAGWGHTRASASFPNKFHAARPGQCNGNVCNCSRNGGGWIWDGWDISEAPPRSHNDAAVEACVGPFAFPKGPLKFFSAATVRWLVETSAADVAYAEQLFAAETTRQPGSTSRIADRVSEDAQIGYWLSRHPSLRLVALHSAAWTDTWSHVGSLSRLLSAHRVPWDMFAWLQRRTQALWRDAASLHVHMHCADGPPCRHCAQARGQHVCRVAAELPPRTVPSANCTGKCTCSAREMRGERLRELTAESAGRCKWRDRLEGAPCLRRSM